MFYTHIMPHSQTRSCFVHSLATHPLPELVGDVTATVLIVLLAAAIRYHLLFQSLVPVCKPSHTTALPLCNAEKNVNVIQLIEGRSKRAENLPASLHYSSCHPVTQHFLNSASLHQSLATKKDSSVNSCQKLSVAYDWSFEIQMHRDIFCF